MDLGWDPRSFAQHIERRYYVRHIDTGAYHLFGDLFRRNPLQVRFAQRLWEELQKGGATRIICLKSRKPGVSTFTGCFQYDVVTQLQGFSAGVLAHTDESTTELFEMVKTFWARTEKLFKPPLARMNGTRIKFGLRYLEELEEAVESIQSSYTCATAGGEFPFAGSTPNTIHFSEAAKFQGDYKRQRDIIMNVLNAVPLRGTSCVVVESTANGVGNWFEQTWKEAWKERDKPKNPGDWVPIFLSWKDDPANTLDVPSNYIWEDWPVDDREQEDMLVGKYGLNRGQLYFRRQKLKGVGGEKIDAATFDQDYPHDPSVAFLSHGRPAINPAILNRQLKYERQPISTYTCNLAELPDDVAIQHPVVGFKP